jgi:ribose 5-phosphate isomerase B
LTRQKIYKNLKYFLMKKIKLAIGNDHAGVIYKEKIKAMLTEAGYEIFDAGTNTDDSVDYPDFAHPVANKVADKDVTFGILICGSGNGVAITANKHEAIRAALCWKVELAKLARAHNNANIICIPARFVSLALAKNMINAFLTEKFEGGRHLKRVKKIAC